MPPDSDHQVRLLRRKAVVIQNEIDAMEKSGVSAPEVSAKRSELERIEACITDITGTRSGDKSPKSNGKVAV